MCVCIHIYIRTHMCMCVYVCLSVFLYIYSLILFFEKAWEQCNPNKNVHIQCSNFDFYISFPPRKESEFLKK